MKHLATLWFAVLLALSPLLSGAAAPVNINSADARALETSLVGVGPKTATAIVDYRAKHGPFKSADDLAKVKGIGSKLVEKNRSNILLK